LHSGNILTHFQYLYYDEKMDIKFIIWDLDDTLWQGTLADSDEVHLNKNRAALIRAYNHCGLISAICSKNDYSKAKEKLDIFNLWDEFVTARIAFTPKGSIIKKLIEDMQLRAINVLFVDDNPHNLYEVKSMVPDINILDAKSPECDAQLQKILDDNKHIQKNRVTEYRILQAKIEDRQHQAVSNEEFLKSSDIHIAFAVTMENLDFKERILELINRSNQLNYTQSRTTLEKLTAMMMDIMAYESCSVFVWDKYGYYGLVGFAMIDRRTQVFEHLTFSCRVMHMGIESAILKKIKIRHPAPDITKLKIPLNLLDESWLNEEKFYEPTIRNMIREKENTLHQKEVKIKITYSCMSAGIAFYSRYRDVIDFDGAKFDQPNRYLCFSNILKNHAEVSTQFIPQALVYGAAIDYYHTAWTPDRLPLNPQHFMTGLQAFCQFLGNNHRQVLVILPPENMPEHCYRPENGNTRETTTHFNNIWRTIAPSFPFITILELTGFVTITDLADPAHYHAGFLQKMTERIDTWYESIMHYDSKPRSCTLYIHNEL